MLKSFLGKSLGAGEEKGPSSSAAFLSRAELDRLKTLIEFFPIGKKLRYYPEFKKEIVFDTLVVAYCVNGAYVYSGDSIERDAEGHPAAFRTGEHGAHTPVAALKLFQLLVPDTSDLEMKLDYHRRALIGRGRQFNKGNYISLISNAGGKGVSTIDTEVAKQVVLPDGPYAHSNMILLTPDLHTLSVTDQRRKSRAKTCVPVVLSLAGGRLSGPCTIVDISEGAMRIRVRDRETQMPAMQRGDELTLDIDLGEGELQCTLKASVVRRSAESCVIQLIGMIRDGRLGSFTPLDLLALKSGLLNYGS